MRRDRGGKEENQGNYNSKIEGDARFHEEQLRQKGWPRLAGYLCRPAPS